jgi:hypothetical protein
MCDYMFVYLLSGDASGEEDSVLHVQTLTSTPKPKRRRSPSPTPSTSTSRPGKRVQPRLPMNIPGAEARKKRKTEVKTYDIAGEMEQFQAWSDASVQRELARDAVIHGREDEMFERRVKVDQGIAKGIYSHIHLWFLSKDLKKSSS